MTAYYTVGVVTKPHGLRGEVRVYPRTDFPEERFSPGSRLWLRPPGAEPVAELEVRSGRQHQNLWIVGFKGYHAISDVESWRGYELCVPEDMLHPLPEGAYYYHQLVGLEVISDEGEPLGVLAEVWTPGANDVYVVRKPGQPDLLLPAIRDVILSVDLEARRMTVHLLPGLRDGEEDE
ncbi:ribosome maturation factor RimM [Alicyclobacillus sendaiensis]|uniref:ribosome maturation factor RimM n=1 Tax=Alicyclobacillus sendaiensis TaxID=192387 RepID=UPI000784E648|nr:ribosome maturation factor RimM [Alicyclobacillus sendaiensis]